MSDVDQSPTSPLAVGDELHGFRVLHVTPLPRIRLTAVECLHTQSGARFIHLMADDPENLICLAFRTPPPDDAGLPHILEHMVLCGSKKFPVKDPFTELLKTSLATFLNAMTASDFTLYPCASMVHKDFANLARVYIDAVFFPNITEMHFKQEGHHLTFEKPDDPTTPLKINGIVYNEMKGVFSSLDSLIGRTVSRSLFPENAYGLESGGDPEAIPQLTHKQLVDFHQRYYHPSNAFIVAYGDLPTAGHLKMLDEQALNQFHTLDVDTTIQPQSRWDNPTRETHPYAIGGNEDAKEKAATVAAWFTNDATDVKTTLAMSVLSSYLLEHAGSPLRKALIDSKLGQELTGSGYSSWQRDTYFTVGLKGSEVDRADAIIALVQKTLADQVAAGLNHDMLEAELHRFELSARQQAGGGPLWMLYSVYGSWIHGVDPLMRLRLDEQLNDLRKTYESTPRFFETLLQAQLIDNPHYAVHIFEPDGQLNARKDAEFAAKMAAQKAKLSADQLAATSEQAVTLKKMQGLPNTAESLATLPRLKLDDAPRDPVELDTTESTVAGVTMLRTDMWSNGVNYLQLSFDLRGLDESLLDDLALFPTALTEMGAGDDDYAAAGQREASCCGGIGAGASLFLRSDDTNDLRLTLSVGASALDHKMDDMLALLLDRLHRGDLSDMARFEDLNRQRRVNYRSRIISSGSAYAGQIARSPLSDYAALSERLTGVTQYRRAEALAGDFQKLRDQRIDSLKQIAAYVRDKAPVIASFVGGDAGFEKVSKALKTIAAGSRAEPARINNGQASTTPTLNKAVAAPSEVAYVAQAMRAPGVDTPAGAGLAVLAQQLRYGYLWDRIRVEGGAYGAQVSYDPYGGTFTLASYRDPHIAHTLDAYAGIFDHVASMDLSDDAVGQAIIGAVKTQHHPIRVRSAASTAIGRHTHGSTVESRRRRREQLLNVTGNDIRDAAAQLRDAYKTATTCVLAGREKIDAENTKLATPLEVEDL